jgi:hypothetical protein
MRTSGVLPIVSRIVVNIVIDYTLMVLLNDYSRDLFAAIMPNLKLRVSCPVP